MAYSGLPVLNAIVGPAPILAVLVGNLVTSAFRRSSDAIWSKVQIRHPDKNERVS